MYKKILVALENSESDRTLLPHIKKLAAAFDSELLLVHVADGWVARHYEELQLSESDEMKQDRMYLKSIGQELKDEGFQEKEILLLGNPPEEILKIAELESCDLIAMTSHGHRLLEDIIYGSTIEEVRHKSSIPLFIVKWQKN